MSHPWVPQSLGLVEQVPGVSQKLWPLRVLHWLLAQSALVLQAAQMAPRPVPVVPLVPVLPVPLMQVQLVGSQVPPSSQQAIAAQSQEPVVPVEPVPPVEV